MGHPLLLLMLASTLCPQGDVEVDAPAEDKRPNLILLVTDDQPHDALGCAGHGILQTPHIDGLARSGVRFTHAFATTPICAASRASLLTGRYERSHCYTFGQPPLTDELVDASYPSLLRRDGYRVGFVGKFGVRVRPGARARMFEYDAPGTYPYVPREGAETKKEEGSAPVRHLTERNTDRAIAFLRAEADPRPFCLTLSFQAPHAEDHNADQYVWPASVDHLYRDTAIPPPKLGGPAFFESLPEFLQTGLNRERWGWRFDTPEKHARMVAGYYRMLSGVDLGVGRLVAALDDLGLRDNTVIALVGDNGYFLGERGFAGKWTMHERSIRVPLVIHDPRQPEARRGALAEGFALNVDIAPTLLALAGVDIPEAMQGRSLRPLLEGADMPWRREVLTEHLWEHKRIPRTEALRTRRWKYIRYLDHPEFEELYDLEQDPDEEHNLAAQPQKADLLKQLRTRCARAASRAAR